jgi:hypothetical protein
MDFKKLFSIKTVLIGLIVLVIAYSVIKLFTPQNHFAQANSDATVTPQVIPTQEADKPIGSSFIKAGIHQRKTDSDDLDQDDAVLQEQLEQDRKAQKETKLLKTKLEQTNLELDQEKALAEINKLKIDNVGAFKDPSEDTQKDFPEIKVDFIGGDSAKKEAILSIGGNDYQVKEKSNPTDNIQVVSITDSSVTLHFSAPQNVTKTIDYIPG